MSQGKVEDTSRSRSALYVNRKEKRMYEIPCIDISIQRCTDMTMGALEEVLKVRKTILKRREFFLNSYRLIHGKRI